MQFLSIKATMEAGQTLAAADRILIDPEPGRLVQKTEDLLSEIVRSDVAPGLVCHALIRLGMNFAGRDTEVVGYSAEEAESSFEQVIQSIGRLDPAAKNAMGGVVTGILADMKSVNRADSLPGLLAERVELQLDSRDPGVSFLRLLKEQFRSNIYWRMIGEDYAKFGNDYARGLEYLRHLGFCQVSTNPVLAAKAFDEDPKLTDQLKDEICRHPEWMRDPEAHADAVAMAATLIALWPNLAVFRPLALHTELKDFMVSFQLNPNIADDAGLSITDAKQAYQLAADYLKHYDEWLDLGTRAGEIGPNIVFKVAASSEAAQTITRELNREGIGTNNTVVYSVGQEVQLILDAFKGKAEASKQGKQVTRTYETNMGGRFVSHLREVAAEHLFLQAGEKGSQAQAHELLNALSRLLQIDIASLQSLANATVAEKARTICSFKYLKTLDQPVVLKAAELAGIGADRLRQLEDDLRKAGTLVARRVHGVFYSQQNRLKWISHLQKTFDLSEDEAAEVYESMDVLPASKRIPEDTFHALSHRNMCHTEFPNQARAVHLKSEQPEFRLEEFRESVAASYEAAVVERLSAYPDFCLGYSLSPELKQLLMGVGLDEVENWAVDGIKQEGWFRFGPVVKTSEEFRAAYVAFRAKCVSIAREVSTSAVVETGQTAGRTGGKS